MPQEYYTRRDGSRDYYKRPDGARKRTRKKREAIIEQISMSRECKEWYEAEAERRGTTVQMVVREILIDAYYKRLYRNRKRALEAEGGS